jgi:hypothetical protein
MDPAEGIHRRKEVREQRRRESSRRWYIAVLAGSIAALAVVYASWHIYVSKECEANELDAIEALRAISRAQEYYHSRYSAYGDLLELRRYSIGEDAPSYSLMPHDLSQASTPEQALKGFYFIVKAGTSNWSAVAKPAIPGRTGRVSFYVDDTGVVRFRFFRGEDDLPARSDSPVLP